MKTMFIRGHVLEGAGRGKGLGAPTLNLDVTPEGLDFGVYVGRVTFEQKKYSCVFHWGARPTFDEAKPILEIHLLDASGNFYGKQLCLEVLDYLRPVRHFLNSEELRRQIQEDVKRARAFFA